MKNGKTMLRAVIYVRVSTEIQAERVSPEGQAQDGHVYCEAKGYIVVGIYQDIERYKVGRKMVEPSGTRADRPGFKRMLADAYSDKFDVIIAWREDRLYRSYRPMLDILDCLKDTGVEIELVKETFDQRIAPVKAWAAQMELDARRDRVSMGMIGRLLNGKIAAGCSTPPFGYDYDPEKGVYVINETEAYWLRKIWEWYGSGIQKTEIRRRLIAAGVEQKGKKSRKHIWHKNCIEGFLKREHYFTGDFQINWAGQIYHVPIPPLIDSDLYQAVRREQAKWKNYPSGKSRQIDRNGQPVYKVYSLAAGLVYCKACQLKMGIYKTKKHNGKGYYTYYRCRNLGESSPLPGCARTVKLTKIDAEIWEKVWKLMSEPGEFERAIEAKLSTIQVEEADAEGECKRLDQELSNLFLERQKYITWAGKGIIDEDDLQVQLFTLSQQEKILRHDLDDLRLLTGNRAEQMKQMAQLFRERIRIGQEAINDETDTPEKEEARFLAKERIVQGVVKRVEIDEHGKISVATEIQLCDDENAWIKHVTPYHEW